MTLGFDSMYIPGYEGRYIINKGGQVYSIPRRGTKGGYLKQSPNAHGYLRVNLTNKNGSQSTRYIHTMVLASFVGPRPNGMQGCHNNGDQTDNRLENLRWDTSPSNNLDKRRHGTDASGERNGRSKLTIWQAEEIRLSYATGEVSYADLAMHYGVDKSTIGRVVCGQRYLKQP